MYVCMCDDNIIFFSVCRRMFLQYVDNEVLLLKKGFISKLVEGMPNLLQNQHNRQVIRIKNEGTLAWCPIK